MLANDLKDTKHQRTYTTHNVIIQQQKELVYQLVTVVCKHVGSGLLDHVSLASRTELRGAFVFPEMSSRKAHLLPWIIFLSVFVIHGY
jgi:hypothetical protein